MNRHIFRSALIAILIGAVLPSCSALKKTEGDATIGRSVPRPTDYADPDPPIPQMISASYFQKPAGPVFAN